MSSKHARQSLENTGEKPIFRFGEFSFDAAEEILYRGAEVVPIPPKTRELLGAFIENAGRILSREDLMNLVWKDVFVEEANLSHHIAVLRKSLGDSKNGNKFIQTIPRKGYRFVHEVKEAGGDESETTEVVFKEFTRAQIIEEEIIETEDDEENPATQAIISTAETSKSLSAAPESTKLLTGRRKIALGAAAGLLIVAAALLAWRFSAPSRPAFFDDSTRASWRVAPVIEGKSRAFGNISRLSFAPDAKFIAFDRTGGGKSSVFVKQIGGGEPVRLTDGKWLDSSPIWSADGQRVAFLSNRDDFVGVWAIPFMGGTPVLLARLAFSPQIPVRLLKWSRDGNRIFYAAATRLYVQDLRETAAEPVLLFEENQRFPAAGDYAIAPDESQFAFYAGAGNNVQLFIGSIDDAAREPRQITFDAGDKRHPAWFAGGRQMTFSSNASGKFQIYALDLPSGEIRQLTTDAAENAAPLVAADDRSILFHATKNEANVYSYSLENKKETAHTASTSLQIFPTVAPDASRVAFQTSPSSDDIFESDLKILALDGSGKTLDIARRVFNPQWSPDGAALAFIRAAGAAQNLWKVSASGQNETQLTKDGINPTNFTFAPFDITHTNFNWSPDGKQIVYASFKSGAANVWTISADGAGSERKWTNYAGEAAAVSGYHFSPDGERIVFFAQMKPPAEGAPRIFRLCWTDGERTQTIYETKAPIRILGWSETGREIFVAQRETNAETKEKSVLLLKIPAAENAQAQTLARVSRTDFDKVRLSPDRRNFIFTAVDAQSESENLYLLPVAGESGAPQRLTDNREPTVYYSGVNFAPDGKMIFYSKQTSGDAYALLSISEKGEK